MTMLPIDLVEAEKATREAIAAKWQALPDSGQVWPRLRYADTMDKYLELFGIQDTANGSVTVIRGAMVRLARFNPMTQNSSVCKTPVMLSYELRVVYQFEDERDDGTNSSDGFNALLMAGHHAFENDQGLGYEDLTHNFLTTVEDADEVEFDDVLCHVITLGLDCEVYVNG